MHPPRLFFYLFVSNEKGLEGKKNELKLNIVPFLQMLTKVAEILFKIKYSCPRLLNLFLSLNKNNLSLFVVSGCEFIFSILPSRCLAHTYYSFYVLWFSNKIKKKNKTVFPIHKLWQYTRTASIHGTHTLNKADILWVETRFRAKFYKCRVRQYCKSA